MSELSNDNLMKSGVFEKNMLADILNQESNSNSPSLVMNQQLSPTSLLDESEIGNTALDEGEGFIDESKEHLAEDEELIDIDNEADLAARGLKKIQIEDDEEEYLMDDDGNIYDLQGNFIGTTNEEEGEGSFLTDVSL